MNNVRMVLAVMTTGLFMATAAQAVDLGVVKVNGFVSQGYIDSSKNNFFGDSTSGGSFQFNELGLDFQSQINDKLRVGAQLLSRDLGKDGNNDVRLDWAYGDYHYSDYLGVRFGKVKLPFGFFNEGRDSDFLRTMIFLPQSIYDENKRDVLVAYQGGGLYGNIPLGPLGDLDYHGYLGTINFNNDSVFINNLKQNAASFVKSGAGNSAATLTSFDLKNDYITGASVIFNPPVTGLKLGMSYLRVMNDMKFTAANSTHTPVSGEFNNKANYVGSLEYTIGDLTLTGEYSELQHRNEVFAPASQSYDQQGYYGMASYSPLKDLTLSALYDVYYQNKDDKDGSNFIAQGKPDFMAWRKDFGVGIRYDVNQNWTMKADYHYIDGCAQSMTTYNDANSLDRYWSYIAIKSSFNF